MIIDDKGLYELNDDDFLFLFKSSITKMMLGYFEATCSNCQNVAENGSSLKKLNCTCQFCLKCMSDYINQSTDGKIIFNCYEKSKICFLNFSNFRTSTFFEIKKIKNFVDEQPCGCFQR